MIADHGDRLLAPAGTRRGLHNRTEVDDCDATRDWRVPGQRGNAKAAGEQQGANEGADRVQS